MSELKTDWHEQRIAILERENKNLRMQLEQSRNTTKINNKGDNQMDELIKLVEEWGRKRGLDKAESAKQFLKVSEEVGETAAALARNDRDALRDAIGDVTVTLIILAIQNDMDIYECLNCAYDEIKNRTGKTVDGVFIKYPDLHQNF